MENFEWDEFKAKQNIRKHGVSFHETTSVFSDEFSLTIQDNEHSINEDRFIDIGLFNKSRIIVVIYTERDVRIRIISARLATKKEKSDYEKK